MPGRGFRGGIYFHLYSFTASQIKTSHKIVPREWETLPHNYCWVSEKIITFVNYPWTGLSWFVCVFLGRWRRWMCPLTPLCSWPALGTEILLQATAAGPRPDLTIQDMLQPRLSHLHSTPVEMYTSLVFFSLFNVGCLVLRPSHLHSTKALL